MIVKNESHIILECLNSVYKYIDYWVICDTGSTDNTKEIITNFFKEKGIPGEIHDHEWKNFGHNRTLAFRAAEGKADYAWVIDADDYLEGELVLPNTKEIDSYALRIKRGSFFWWRNQVFKLDSKWEYKGVLHEYAACEKQNPKIVKLEGTYNICARTMGGARNVGITPVEKYSRDAVILEEAMKEDPTNTRHQFYLAQSYFDSQQWEKADQAYQKRVEMGGWEEEVFYSLYRVAMIAAIVNKPFTEIKEKFLMAWNYRPIRAEPLYQISKLYRMINQPRLAYLYAKMAKDMPYPAFDILFIDEDVYKWQIDDEIAATSFYLHRYDEGVAACESLIANPHYPEAEKARMQQNLDAYKKKMEEMGAALQAMRQMQGNKPTINPAPVAEKTIDEVDRRERISKMLNRKKDRKAKSR
jgi:glycosyltransferase involved in cell wall biosynthesis